MTTEKKYGMLAFKIVSFLCLAAMVICFICDFAVNRSIVWSGYPIISIWYVWLIILPLLLAKKKKLLLSLAALTIATIPFLYALERLTPVKGWFFALGVPITVISAVALWLTFAAVKFTKLNWWYLSAIIVFLFGIVVSTTIRYYVSVYLGSGFFSLDNFINLLSCIAVTVLLAILGGLKKQQGERAAEEQKQEE